ncbi:protein JINGUBANG-like [Salvia hispanica]|uniref:protein JINGUBANG-like n=1 Tax=Salvia hispanica TaxID=49212 RepID=UPI002009990E|nr:protein JINGUBANG-like [Salvia hispanica]
MMLQEHTPLLSTSSTPSNTSSSSNSSDAESESPAPSFRYNFQDFKFKLTAASAPISSSQSYKSLAVLSGHVGSVSCLALCGEFILSASQAKDIIVWQHPDLRQFTKFGQGDGAVKALVAAGNRVFTAHQDSRIRAWKVSRSSENVFKLIDTLPTTKDYLGKFMKQSNYVQTRRHHKLLWIEHADTISCLAVSVSAGLIYSGSWDKTIKVWRVSDFKCLESIKAHGDAINSIAARGGTVYSGSADGRIKVWARGPGGKGQHSCRKVLEGHKDVSFNAVVVTEGFVYGGGSDGSLMGWSCGEGWRGVCDVRAHETAVLCLCLMGERMMCSGSADKSVCVWRREVGGGVCRHMVIRGHQGPVKCLQASPLRVGGGGGFMLYSGSLDKSLRVWWVPAAASDHHHINGDNDNKLRFLS